MNKIPLTVNESNYLYKRCRKLGIILGDVHVFRSKKLKWAKAVACFSLWHPECVFVCNDQPSIDNLIPHIAHELEHRRQFRKYGLLIYSLLAFPLWRRLTIEKSAYRLEDKIRDKITGG